MFFGYSALQWLSFFMIYSFFGWIFESTYCSIKEHKLLNRGFCHGPWIPLYGSGAVLMVLITQPYQDSIVLVYLSGIIGATLLELATGFAMFHIFKIRWWDYSAEPFNLDGYICLGASIAWGFLAVILTEVLHPMVLRLLSGWSHGFQTIFVTVFYIVFAADMLSSFLAAWDIRKRLIALSKIKLEMTELIASIDDLTDDVKAALLRQANEMKLTMREQAEEIRATTEELRSALQARKDAALSAVQERKEAVLDEVQERTSETVESIQEKADAVADGFRMLLRANRSGAAGERARRLASELPGKDHLLVSEEIIKRLTALQEKRAGITDRMSWWSATMLRNNPSASSTFGGFADMKKYVRRTGKIFQTKIEDLIGDFLDELQQND